MKHIIVRMDVHLARPTRWSLFPNDTSLTCGRGRSTSLSLVAVWSLGFGTKAVQEGLATGSFRRYRVAAERESGKLGLFVI